MRFIGLAPLTSQFSLRSHWLWLVFEELEHGAAAFYVSPSAAVLAMQVFCAVLLSCSVRMTKRSPVFRKLPALVEQVATPIGGLDLIGDGMS